MSDEEVKKLYGIIQQYSPDMADDFLSADDQQAWFNENSRMLESLHGFTDKYKNTAQLKTNRLKGLSELYEQQSVYQDNDGNVMLPTEERMASFRKEYPGIGEDEIVEWFNKSNEYKKFYEDEAEKEAQKNLRKKEVKDWPWYQDLIASDYEKQRYIDDPKSALFGEQAPKLGEAESTRWGSIGDLTAGVAGSIGDAVPGLGGVVIGPVIRGARDVTHKVTGSPYQKDLTQIAKDFGKDITVNAGAWLLPNMRKTAKAADLFADPEVARALEVAQETKNIQKGLSPVAQHYHIPEQEVIDKYRELGVAYPHNDIALAKAIDDMPASELKSELQKIVNSTPLNKPLNRAKIQETTKNYANQTNKFTQDVQKYNQEIMAPAGAQDYGVRTMIVNGKPTEVVISPEASQRVAELAGNSGNYMANALKAKSYDELSNLQKLKYRGNQFAHAMNSGYPGQLFMQEFYTGVGRGKSPTIVETAIRKKELEDRIDNVISTYSSLWSKTKKPLGYESNPIIKKAWDKWSKQ